MAHCRQQYTRDTGGEWPRRARVLRAFASRVLVQAVTGTDDGPRGASRQVWPLLSLRHSPGLAPDWRPSASATGAANTGDDNGGAAANGGGDGARFAAVYCWHQYAVADASGKPT